MNRISTYDFRDNLAFFLSEVAKSGKPLVVEKYKKGLVVVLPYDDKYVASENWSSYFGFIKDEEDGTTYVKKIRRNKKEGDYVEKLRRTR